MILNYFALGKIYVYDCQIIKIRIICPILLPCFIARKKNISKRFEIIKPPICVDDLLTSRDAKKK